MPGMTERHPSHGPKLTYFPYTSVIGGRLCEPDPDHPGFGYIRHASADSTTVVGMAKNDATRKAGGPFEVSDPATSPTFPVNDFIPTDVVCYDDGVFDVEVTTDVPEGARLVAATDGKFKVKGSSTGVVVARNVGKAATAGGLARVRLLPN